MSDEQKRKMSERVKKGRDMRNRFVYATLGVSH
jgi:hypothetical protein